MKDLFRLINDEISSSKDKLELLKSSTISEKAKKLHVFSDEIQKLNKTLPEIINSFIKSNGINDIQEKEIKDFTNNAMTDFIVKSDVPGINPNFKVDIQ